VVFTSSIADRRAQRIVEQLSSARLPGLDPNVTVEFLAQGTYCTLFRLSGNGPDLVLRAATFEDASAGHGLATEHAVLEVLNGDTAPRPVRLDLSRRNVPFAYRVETLCRGDHPPEFTPELIEELAAALARTHSLSVTPGGEIPGGLDDTPGGALMSLFDGPEARSPAVRELVERGRSHLRSFRKLRGRRVALIHNDLHLGNILRDSDRLCFVDWEHAEIGDPAQDIAILFQFDGLLRGRPPLPGPLQEAFLGAYRRRTGDETITERVRLYEPLVVLLQAISWSGQLAGTEVLPPHLCSAERLGCAKRGLATARRLLEGLW
jgi:aminoglycoside phosphotransferase (APT) family kinase protein